MPDPGTERDVSTGDGLRLTVTTPWYPGVNNAFSGSFVQGAVQAVRSTGRVADVRVVHSEDWPTPSDRFSTALVRRAMRALATRPDGSSRLPSVQVREGELLRVPTPVRAGAGFADHALVHESSVRAALDGRPLQGDVVHGHVGLVRRMGGHPARGARGAGHRHGARHLPRPRPRPARRPRHVQPGPWARATGSCA